MKRLNAISADDVNSNPYVTYRVMPKRSPFLLSQIVVDQEYLYNNNIFC